MIEPALQPQRIRLPSGSVFTGTRAFACDGMLIEAVVDGTVEEPHIASCTVLEMHDLSVGRRRSRYEVGAFLRRALRRVREEGLLIILGDQVLCIPSDRIVAEGVHFQQYCARLPTPGPFDPRLA